MTTLARLVMKRCYIRWALTMAGLVVVLTPHLLQAAERDEPIRALERYPYLADSFPFGFWSAHQASDQRLSGEFREPYKARRQKLFRYLARHHVNAVFDDVARAGRCFSCGPDEILAKYSLDF